MVKIRKPETGVTLAQVEVLPESEREIRLDGGSYEMVLRMNLTDGPHYFKGAAFRLPTDTDGEVVLTFKPLVMNPGPGQSLQEISPAEFER
jgi:hypothetical protein